MRKKRTLIMLALAGLLASFVTFASSEAAVAAEHVPELQWPSADVGNRTDWTIATNSTSVTVGCGPETTFAALKSFNTSGQGIRELEAFEPGGTSRCIRQPVVDKNGDLYGKAYNAYTSNRWSTALIAYSDSTLKWEYDTGCVTAANSPKPVIGADGNIYTISDVGGNRLIGLTPDVAIPATQPEKVLDIPLSGDDLCNARPFATKDGVGYIVADRAYLFSYGGMPLGSTPSGTTALGEEGINANGRAFYAVPIGSSFQVKVYDLNSGTPDWTAFESLFGQSPQLKGLYATPDGGVVVQVNRPKATGTQRVDVIIKLSASGQKLWEEELSPVGGLQKGPYLHVDTTGKIVVLREVWLTTNNDPDASTLAIAIGVLDGNGDEVYGKVMHGDLDAPMWSHTGYSMTYQDNHNSAIGPNTLYLVAAHCGEYSCPGERRLYPIKVSGLGLDYPRGAVLERTQRPAALYRAYGDSFSAGEGVEPFEAGTAIPNLNTCHRSDYAYPRLIAGTSPKIPSLGSDGFRACSGAVTENITDAPQWNEGTQLDLPVWPDTTTQLVTLTIGGNDIKFADFGRACFFGTCEIGSAAYNASLNEINNTLPGKLVETYKEILQRTPNAKVYVLGYPQVVANKSTTDVDDPRCIYMQDGSTKWADAKAARDIVTKLNEKILAKVDAVRALNADFYQRLKYVPLDGADSPFNGHEVCGTSGTSWFKNVDAAINDTAYAFHPNKLGQEGYATVAGAAINAG